MNTWVVVRVTCGVSGELGSFSSVCHECGVCPIPDAQLAQDNVTVKDRFALFLDLQLPALLGVFHFIQHVGSAP